MPTGGQYFWNEQRRSSLEELELTFLPTATRRNVGKMADRFSLAGSDPGGQGMAVFMTLLLLLAEGVAVTAAESTSSIVLTVIAALIFPCLFVPLLRDGRRRRGMQAGRRRN